ncbi:hypothetical protein HPB51_019397 [Rhipicephalus microplus]|uniref:Uncharacterized protein n=1 Tax=Rhipicephalus microplus TaxID=6941 RepID=A0A9J6DBJ8_RHIMP|nr:hypothetical protein HPB51_019397 [Rhipicephalus microplus]
MGPGDPATRPSRETWIGCFIRLLASHGDQCDPSLYLFLRWLAVLLFRSILSQMMPSATSCGGRVEESRCSRDCGGAPAAAPRVRLGGRARALPAFPEWRTFMGCSGSCSLSARGTDLQTMRSRSGACRMVRRRVSSDFPAMCGQGRYKDALPVETLAQCHAPAASAFIEHRWESQSRSLCSLSCVYTCFVQESARGCSCVSAAESAKSGGSGQQKPGCDTGQSEGQAPVGAPGPVAVPTSSPSALAPGFRIILAFTASSGTIMYNARAAVPFSNPTGSGGHTRLHGRSSLGVAFMGGLGRGVRLHKRSVRSSSLTSIAATTLRLQGTCTHISAAAGSWRYVPPSSPPAAARYPARRQPAPRGPPQYVSSGTPPVDKRRGCHPPCPSAQSLSVRCTVRTAAPVHASPAEALPRERRLQGFFARGKSPREANRKGMKTTPRLRGHRRRWNKS